MYEDREKNIFAGVCLREMYKRRSYFWFIVRFKRLLVSTAAASVGVPVMSRRLGVAQLLSLSVVDRRGTMPRSDEKGRRGAGDKRSVGRRPEFNRLLPRIPVKLPIFPLDLDKRRRAAGERAILDK